MSVVINISLTQFLVTSWMQAYERSKVRTIIYTILVPVVAPKPQNMLSGILDFLIPYYDALAMIQTECFMSRFVHSKVVSVTDAEMKLLEWLHENVRNEYEHFVPKYYLAPVNDLIECSSICVKLSNELLFKCGNVVPHDNFSQIRDIVEKVEKSLSVLIFQTSANHFNKERVK